MELAPVLIGLICTGIPTAMIYIGMREPKKSVKIPNQQPIEPKTIVGSKQDKKLDNRQNIYTNISPKDRGSLYSQSHNRGRHQN